MRRRVFFWLLGLTCIQAVGSAAQPVDSLRTQTTPNMWIEKLYLHTDRPHYLTGEKIFFRIFYVDGFQHKPADLSKIAYVELIRADGSAVQQVKVKLTSGGGSGFLELPLDLATGSYHLRAYTRWMRNDSERLFYHRTFTIINPMEALPASSPAVQPPGFFPEGGHLLAGVENRVGFLIAHAGSVAGVIRNQRQEIVARFSAGADGRGSFLFTPETEQAYSAVFSVDEKTVIRASLPPVTTTGVHLRATQVNNELQIHVFETPPGSNQLHVLLHQSRMNAKRLTVKIENGSGVVRYPWSALPPGITRITVFNNQLQPVAERLVFKTPPQPVTVSVTPNHTQVRQRSKVALSLAAGERNTEGEMAVSVYRLDSLPARAASLHAYLWLESELGTEIEKPEKYLFPSDSSQQLADLLMLTTGWSRYSQPSNRPVSFVAEIHGAWAEGQATDDDGRPAAGISLLASARGRGQIYSAVTDQSGKFFFELPDLAGPGTLYLRNWNDPTQRLRASWISPYDTRRSFMPRSSTLSLSPQSLRRVFIHQQVEAAYNPPETRADPKPDTATLPFYGRANESYRLDDYTRFPTMEEVFREYVNGVWVRKNKQGFYFLLLNRLSQTLMDRDNLLLVNGQPISNVNKLMEFNPLDVDRIDVIDRKFFAGPITFQGIVNVITTSAAAQANIPDEALLEMAYEGYQLYREHAPRQYNPEAAKFSRIPDFRHQLYWNPNQPLRAGAANIEFYTSDTTGSFIVVVEGMTTSGQALTGTMFFTVAR